MKIAGIDYSMTSPSITVYDIETDKYDFYFYTSNKKLFWKDNFHGTLFAKPDNTEERFDHIASWAMSCLERVERVFLEGYAFGAKGLVFHIGENTGVLKHKLWTAGITFETIAPTELKKFAFGKGNAKKIHMEEAFVKETGIDVRKEIGQPEKSENPSSDIIDSYFLARMGLHRMKSEV